MILEYPYKAIEFMLDTHFGKEFKKYYEEDKNMEFKAVKVQIVGISWLTESIGEFYYFMAIDADDSLFDIEFLKVIL